MSIEKYNHILLISYDECDNTLQYYYTFCYFQGTCSLNCNCGKCVCNPKTGIESCLCEKGFNQPDCKKGQYFLIEIFKI